LRGGYDAHDCAIIFRDLVGELDVLNVDCDKCGLGVGITSVD
jgi:hypothetical protein